MFFFSIKYTTTWEYNPFATIQFKVMDTATTSSAENVKEENIENKYELSTSIFAGSVMDSSGEISNTSYRLHTSHCSTISNESDLSLLSLSLDKEMDVNSNDIDELPAFEIRLISPLGRTPSPIDSEDMATPTRPVSLSHERLAASHCHNNPEFVALHDINAQISPPSDHGDEHESSLSRTSSLETIFEGVFLNTPPRQRFTLQNHRHSRSRTNLLEKVALNRLHAGKENQSPSSKHENLPSPRRSSLDFSCIKHTENGFS